MNTQEHGHVCLSSFTSPEKVRDDVGADDERLPEGLASVIDSHVHLFPERVFDAIWRWFGEHGWPIRYTLYAQEVVDFLKTRGVSKMVGLTYSHVPDMARSLNVFMAQLCQNNKNIVGLGTVLPGEKEAMSSADEYDDYARLLEQYPNLMLDSTMVLAHYFVGEDPFWMLRRFPSRVMYGTDFPNLPYAWNREIKRLAASTIDKDSLSLILSANAEALFFAGQK